MTVQDPMLPPGIGFPGGLDGNPYDTGENPMAHYNRELLRAEWPSRVEQLVEKQNWTTRTKDLILPLLIKLGSQELQLAKLSEVDRRMAMMEFEIEVITATA